MLDEPMTALDLRHQSLVVAALKNFSALGTGQLIVMHDINLAAEVADEIVLMSEGKMLASGEPLEVLTASSLQATFNTPMVQIGEGRDRFFKTRPG
jgi:iron complex transport system ATP-binding protein